MNPDKLNRLRSSIKEEKMEKKAKKAKKEPNIVRFIFGKDMTPEDMVDAVIRIAKKYKIPFEDKRMEHGIPIVDSRKKMTKEQRKKWNED